MDDRSITQRLLSQLETEFGRRRFTVGLMLAFTDFIRELGVGGARYKDWAAFAIDFPPQQLTTQGRRANTLIVRSRDGLGTLSIRGHYNHWENVIRADNKRFDYPNAAPHATQAWHDYKHWISDLLQLSDSELTVLQDEVLGRVLTWLPSHEFQGETRAINRPFVDLLREFPIAAEKGERPGAALQGMVYALLRADAPHLHLDISKVGAGSKRLQRVGDIDGWSGKNLVLSAEVKAYEFGLTSVPGVANFVSEISRRGALGILAVESFKADARAAVADLGLIPLDLQQLRQLVEIWDPLKQEAAVDAFEYYVHHIEKNSGLMKRLAKFRVPE